MVFHWRLRSHLFYTLYVFSQCQTRVKLNHFSRGGALGYPGASPLKYQPSLHISWQGPTVHLRLVLWALLVGASFQMGLARPLSLIQDRGRHLSARYDGRQDDSIGLATGFP